MKKLSLVLALLISFNPVLAKNRLERGPYLQAATDDSIVVRWKTKKKTPTLLKYKAYGTKEDKQYQDLVLTKDHEAKLTGLNPRSKYFYTIHSQKGQTREVLGQDRLKSFFFTTLPPKSKQDYQAYVWVLGDPGTNGTKKYEYSDKKSQLKVRDAFYNYHATQKLPPPNLILTLGDNAYDLAKNKDFQRTIFDVYGDVLSYIPLFPVFGNHDSGFHKKNKTYNARSYPKARGTYYDVFSFPNEAKAYYSFDFANTHFIVLDSYDSMWEELKADGSNFNKIWTAKSTSNNSMLEWLKRDLYENKNADWTIVAYHHPAYATNDDDINEGVWQDWMKTFVVPILEAHKVDLVLNGHIHNYQRTYPMINFKATSKEKIQYKKGQGTIYTILGSSGQSYKTAVKSNLHAAAYAKEGSILLQIEPQKLELKFISIDNTVLDKAVVVK